MVEGYSSSIKNSASGGPVQSARRSRHASKKFAHSLAAAFAVSQRPLIHIHPNKLVGEVLIHVARRIASHS